MTNKKEFKLCYVNNGSAYFTTQRVTDQWGDDWGDKPYIDNAGPPYKYTKNKDIQEGEDSQPWELYIIKFESHLEEPYDLNVSVLDINSGRVAWLSSPLYDVNEFTNIYAGCSIEEFKKLIKKSGGDIYIKED